MAVSNHGYAVAVAAGADMVIERAAGAGVGVEVGAVAGVDLVVAGCRESDDRRLRWLRESAWWLRGAGSPVMAVAVAAGVGVVVAEPAKVTDAGCQRLVIAKLWRLRESTR